MSTAEKRETWKRVWGEIQWGKQLALGLFFVFSLGLFLHFREVRVKVLELGTTAEHYLLGEIGFSFPDEEATRILKEQALRDIGVIYKIEEMEIREQGIDFEAFLLDDQAWRQQYPTLTFEEVHKGLNALEEGLLQSHFTDARTVQKMRELSASTEWTFLYTPQEEQNSQLLPKEFWGRFEKNVFIEGGFRPEVATFILSHFENKKWSLEKDIESAHFLRHLVIEGIPKVYTHVPAGTKLISPGEKVTQRHLIILKALKQALIESRKQWEPLTILGSLLLSLIFTVFSVIYLRIHHPNLFHSFHKLLLVVAIIIFTLFLAKITEYALVNKSNSLIDMVRYPLFVPFASVLVCLLIGAEVGLFVSAFLLIILGATLAIEQDRFLVMNLVAALITIFYARNLHRRNDVFVVCGKVWLCSIPVILAFNLMENHFWNLNLMKDIVSTFVFMSVTGLLVVGLLPLLESAFHLMTDMTLMEYTDPHSELLRRLTLEAPGTYQHSLVVGNLAEASARAIGANGLFCRVATLYHDVGKLYNPHYFTENQLGGFDIHHLLTPQESAQVIMAHVTEGENLAQKYRLPPSFIDIIREHHGTTLVYYFYCKQVEQMGSDVIKVEDRLFRYPGPKPRTKESAIIMIADCVEAASRCLEDITELAVVELVDRIVIERIEEGQLEECQLTFEELGVIKKALVRTLVVARHLRVKYPTRDAQEKLSLATENLEKSF
jgi:cyclic-di-AMP phosphodiesterase PgpH